MGRRALEVRVAASGPEAEAEDGMADGLQGSSPDDEASELLLLLLLLAPCPSSPSPPPAAVGPTTKLANGFVASFIGSWAGCAAPGSDEIRIAGGGIGASEECRMVVQRSRDALPLAPANELGIVPASARDQCMQMVRLDQLLRRLQQLARTDDLKTGWELGRGRGSCPFGLFE